MPVSSQRYLQTFFSYIGFASTFILYPFLTEQTIGICWYYNLEHTDDAQLFIHCDHLFYLFSPDEITDFNQPVINILKSIEFKFIERIEVLFIAFFLLIFSLSWILPMYISVFCTSWVVGKQDHRNHLRWLWLLIAIGTLFLHANF